MSSPHDLLAAFKPRWDLLASYSTDSDRMDYHIKCVFGTVDCWFFAPKRDWYQYSFRTQNMDRQCNWIVKVEHITDIVEYSDICYSDYWKITHYYENNSIIDLPQGYRASNEIISSKFNAVQLSQCLEKQMYKVGHKKISAYTSHCFPPTLFFKECSIDFWLKIGRACFAPYLYFPNYCDSPIYTVPEVFCGVSRVCPVCNSDHAAYLIDLVSGETRPYHIETPPCKICNIYHNKYRIIVDDYCHISTNELIPGSIEYHSSAVPVCIDN